MEERAGSCKRQAGCNSCFCPKSRERLSLYCTKATFLGSPGLRSPSTAIAAGQEGQEKAKKGTDLVTMFVTDSGENYPSHSRVYGGGCEKLWVRSTAVGFASPSLFSERGIPSTTTCRRRGKAVTVLPALSPGSWSVFKTSSVDQGSGWLQSPKLSKGLICFDNFFWLIHLEDWRAFAFSTE